RLDRERLLLRLLGLLLGLLLPAVPVGRLVGLRRILLRRGLGVVTVDDDGTLGRRNPVDRVADRADHRRTGTDQGQQQRADDHQHDQTGALLPRWRGGRLWV